MSTGKTIQETVVGAEITPDDARAYRTCLSAFTTGVAIVTTVSLDGEHVGLTVNSFTSLSLEPPMVLWCLESGSASVPFFKKGRPFTINVLTEEQQELAKIFSSTNHDRFKDVAISGDPLGAPIIDGCLSWFECAVDQFR